VVGSIFGLGVLGILMAVLGIKEVLWALWRIEQENYRG
jgi:hypothetical protein